MDMTEVSAASEKLRKALLPKGNIYIQTKMPGKQDGIPEYCQITANKTGFLELGYRLIRVAEGTERPTQKVNELLSNDSDVFFSLELTEELIEEVLDKATAPSDLGSLWHSVGRWAAFLVIALMIYAVFDYFSTG